MHISAYQMHIQCIYEFLLCFSIWNNGYNWIWGTFVLLCASCRNILDNLQSLPKQNPFLMLIKLWWWVRPSFSVWKPATLDILVKIHQNISDISANIFSFINGTTNTVYSVWVMSLENSICDAEISSYIFKKSGKILGKSCHSCQLKSSEATQKLFPPPMS